MGGLILSFHDSSSFNRMDTRSIIFGDPEEIFFEDDFTRIEFSGVAFTKHQHCIQDNKKTLKPNLICNQSDRLIGIRSILDREEVSVNKVKIILLDKATVDAIV